MMFCMNKSETLESTIEKAIYVSFCSIIKRSLSKWVEWNKMQDAALSPKLK